MSLKVSGTSESTPALEPGTYTALCYGLIDLGEQYNQTYDKMQRKVMIMWEIPGETITTEEGTFSRRMTARYTASIGEKAALRRDLENWRGRPFTAAELEEFDLKNIVGAPCLLSVVSREKKTGGTYSAVGGVIKMPKGTPAPMPTREHVVFDFDNPDWRTTFETLEPWIQEILKESETYKEQESIKAETAESTDEFAGFTDITCDDIPF